MQYNKEFHLKFTQIGFHMVSYLRAWQNALNEVAAENGLLLHAFRFNTYILTELVIFFLQTNYNFPKLSQVPSSKSTFISHVPPVEQTKLEQMVGQFLKFYGEQYQVKNHLISLHIGQWQHRHADNQQINLTPEQKRFVECVSHSSRMRN